MKQIIQKCGYLKTPPPNKYTRLFLLFCLSRNMFKKLLTMIEHEKKKTQQFKMYITPTN